jgi:hypothetical protein
MTGNTALIAQGDLNRRTAHNSDPNTSSSYQAPALPLTRPIPLQTSVGHKSACGPENGMAPRSFEGFMLNLGNGLVKAGQVSVAKIVYANAQYAAPYATWPYRSVLESTRRQTLTHAPRCTTINNPENDPPLALPNRS